MNRAAVLGLALALGACGSETAAPPGEPPGTSAAESTTINPLPGLEADASAPPVQAEDPTSVAAAVDRVLVYLGAHTQGDAAAADSLWGPSGPPDADGEAVEPFRRSGVRVLSATAEEPTTPEGAAGSVYVRVPATLTVQADGQTSAVRLRYTLRRVNDVSGATARQRRWSLYAVEPAD